MKSVDRLVTKEQLSSQHLRKWPYIDLIYKLDDRKGTMILAVQLA